MSNLQQILGKNFQGTAKKLDDIDLPRIGSQIGVGEDELHAFLEVESNGDGFDDYGRPKILFEPHIFYAELVKISSSQLAEAVKQGLAYKKWGTKPYPKDSYPRLKAAMKINPEAALKAASWGMTQILGRNYTMLGYKNVYEMVWDFMEDEENHVQGCVNFLIKTGAAKHLKARNWAKVAEIYNGKGYKKNKYDTKMAAAFKKWQKIPDTPFNLKQYFQEKNGTRDPNDDVKEANAAGELALSKPQIEYVQRRLHELGYVMVGKIDGKWGTNTSAGVTALQFRMGLPTDGHYSDTVRELLAITDGSNRYEVSEARANTTIKDLRAQGSKTIKATDGIKSTSAVATTGVGVVTAGSAVVEYAPDAITWVGPIKDFFEGWPLWVFGLLALVFIGVMWYKAKQSADARLDDERTGKNVGSPDPSPSPPLKVIDAGAQLPRAMPDFLQTEEDDNNEVEVVGARN